MLPEDMGAWCKSVEERFTKIQERLARLEAENYIMIGLQIAIIGLIIKLLA